MLEVVLLWLLKLFNFFREKSFAVKKTTLYLQSNYRGRLAQLVQSTSFTPRGSGVRIPHRPQKSVSNGLFYFGSLTQLVQSVTLTG